MKKVIGLLFLVGLIPAVYGAAAYYLATQSVAGGTAPGRAFRLAILIGVPVALAGAVQWWDAWQRPMPKLGAFWSPMPPARFVGESLLLHGGIVILALAVQLINEQKQEFEQPHYDFAGAEARLRDLDEKWRSEQMHHDQVVSRPDSGNLAGIADDMDRTSAIQSLSSVGADRDMLRAQIAAARKKASLAKPNPVLPWYCLLLGVAVGLVVTPMQGSRTSGNPITDG